MKIGDEVVCVEVNPGLMKNPKLSEHIVNNDIYFVDEQGYDDINDWIQVSGMRTEWDKTSFRKVDNKPFTNAITKELSVQVLTEEKKPQIERIEIKEKELV